MRTWLFLDIDGVFSIPTQETGADYEKFGYGLYAWPIPLAYPLLREIDADRTLKPIWMSCWDSGSILWNARAGTPFWPVGYHLRQRQIRYAKDILPFALFDQGIDQRRIVDWKLIAVQYHLRRCPPAQPVLWIEDGFSSAAQEWARARDNVRLVDTTQKEMEAALLATAADEVAAARQLIETWKGKQND